MEVYELELDDTALYYSSQTVSWGGNTYSPLTLKRGSVKQTMAYSTKPVNVTFGNVDFTLRSYLVPTDYLTDRWLTIRILFKDLDTGNFLDDSFILFKGRMEVKDQITETEFAITVNHPLKVADQDAPRRHFLPVCQSWFADGRTCHYQYTTTVNEPDVVLNGGFESWSDANHADDWGQRGIPPITDYRQLTSGLQYSGVYSLQMFKSTSDYATISQDIGPILGGRKYEVRLWASGTDGTVNTRLTNVDSDYGQIHLQNVNATGQPTDQWGTTWSYATQLNLSGVWSEYTIGPFRQPTSGVHDTDTYNFFVYNTGQATSGSLSVDNVTRHVTGGTTVTVSGVSAFTVGDTIKFDGGDAVAITAISGNDITIAEERDFTHGSTVAFATCDRTWGNCQLRGQQIDFTGFRGTKQITRWKNIFKNRVR